MPAEIIPTPIQGLSFLRFPVYFDERGYFTETYNREELKTLGIDAVFAQDNVSLSRRNVLRGLHFQSPPYAQAKLIRVISGRILDVAVDIRRTSQTYGHHFKCELISDNLQLYIPEGFAHGFLALEDDTLVSYKCSAVYNKSSEHGLLWDDPLLAINWGIKDPQISDKDRLYSNFNSFNTPFK